MIRLSKEEFAHRNRLDVSDSNRFYSVHVPLHAVGNIALKYSMSAITSKHLGRTRGCSIDPLTNAPATHSMDQGTNNTQIDWLLQGTTYYHLAVSEISRAMAENLPALDSSGNSSLFIGFCRWVETTPVQDRLGGETLALSGDCLLRKIEDLLAAIVLLTLYELMDANIDEWPRLASSPRPHTKDNKYLIPDGYNQTFVWHRFLIRMPFETE